MPRSIRSHDSDPGLREDGRLRQLVSKREHREEIVTKVLRWFIYFLLCVHDASTNTHSFVFLLLDPLELSCAIVPALSQHKA